MRFKDKLLNELLGDSKAIKLNNGILVDLPFPIRERYIFDRLCEFMILKGRGKYSDIHLEVDGKGYIAYLFIPKDYIITT